MKVSKGGGERFLPLENTFPPPPFCTKDATWRRLKEHELTQPQMRHHILTLNPLHTPTCRCPDVCTAEKHQTLWTLNIFRSRHVHCLVLECTSISHTFLTVLHRLRRYVADGPNQISKRDCFEALIFDFVGVRHTGKHFLLKRTRQMSHLVPVHARRGGST